MCAVVVPSLFMGAAVLIALGVLYLAVPSIGIERAARAANAVLMIGGLGLAVNAGWVLLKIRRGNR